MTYTTLDIINKVSIYIKESSFNHYYHGDFYQWKKEYQNYENQYKILFPIEVQNNFPLHDDVLKLIIKNLYNVMPFSKPYILKNYENSLNNIEYLLFPSKKPKKMTIFFSGLSGHKTYNRYSWYWDEEEKWDNDTVYLFLNDLKGYWYVGTEKEPTAEIYIKIIQKTLTSYNIKRSSVITVGGSMGGYGALSFAINMGLKGVIAVHPQITYKSTRKHKVNDWESKIRECGTQFYDLTDYLFKREQVPFIYLEYGLYEADRECAEEFITALQKRQVFLIVRKTNNYDHVTNNPTKQTIESVINLFYNNGFDDDFIK